MTLAADPAESRSRRRERATAETRATILAAARSCLLADGYASLSTRRVADAAGVPLSQIHYHFGSRQALILAVLAAENERLLARQRVMYEASAPLSSRWETACDYLDEDLASGYVRVLMEMVAAGWSDHAIAAAVRDLLGAWFRLLTEVVERHAAAGGSLGPFSPREAAMLMGLPFLGAEAAILLGLDEAAFPSRAALRRVGAVIRAAEAS